MSKPKILIYDLETQPTLAYVWQAWKENISPVQVVDHGKVICWAAKWHGEKQTYFGAEWEPTLNGKDFIDRLYDMMNEADALLTYNGDGFDQKVFNTELLKKRLPPAAPSKSIDMYKVVKKRFRLFHSRMQTVAEALNLAGKTDTGGFELWKGVMQGDLKARKKMEKYNRQDIKVLEDIYDELLPWVHNHPHFSNDGCSNCGSDNLQRRGFHKTKVSTYQRYQCQDCGAWGRERIADKTAHKPKVVAL
jgi:DNA polymerase elongation subunit (family B)